MAYIKGKEILFSASLGGTSGDIKLQEKTVIKNGVVLPDEGFGGLSKVNVDVEDGKVIGTSTIVIRDKSHIARQGYASITVAVPITINTTAEVN